MEFDRLGVFTYSPEENTPAAEMADQVPEEVKEERRDELMELQQEISYDRGQDRIGQELLVMIEGKVAPHSPCNGSGSDTSLFSLPVRHVPSADSPCPLIPVKRP